MIPLLVAVGGGLGAVLRFMVDGAIESRNTTRFPFGTLLVNVTGSLVFGVVLVWVIQHEYNPLSNAIYAAVCVGLLGGYTTFSTASVEGVRLLAEGRWSAGIGHALGMLLACYLAAFMAIMLGVTLWGD